MRRISWIESPDRPRTHSTQLGQSSVGISGLFDNIRRPTHFRIFDTTSVKVEDTSRMRLVNLLVDFEEPGDRFMTSGFRKPNIVS